MVYLTLHISSDTPYKPIYFNHFCEVVGATGHITPQLEMEGETSATAIFRSTDGRMATFRADVTVGVVAHSGERLNNL